jgi:hypothetical protein
MPSRVGENVDFFLAKRSIGTLNMMPKRIAYLGNGQAKTLVNTLGTSR